MSATAPRGSKGPRGSSQQNKRSARATSWRNIAGVLGALIPTANAILLSVQATLAQPGVDRVIPGWVYATVNGGVLIGALLTKIIAEIIGTPIFRLWSQQRNGTNTPGPRKRLDEKKEG